jgi:hypothetical protein
MDYGRKYDFKRPFFEQFRDLYNSVPTTSSVWNFNKTNSDYAVTAWAKNCYLCFDTGFVEDGMYSVTLHDSKQCIDTINCELCELCYYCINTNESYKTFFSRNCTSCTDVWFSQDCVGCTDCIGCTGLRNKSHYIFNKPYSKEEYKKKLEEMKLDTFSGIQKVGHEAESVWKKHPVKYQHSVQAKDCTGDYIYKSTEIRNCFFCGNSQNCAYSQSIIYGPIKDCMDITSVGVKTELDYEVLCAGDFLFRVAFAFEVGTLTDSQYVNTCRQSSNLFGCVSMKSKKYCILNKQYSKEEYEALVPKIIKHMNEMPYIDAKGREYRYGEFFPIDMSPFGYSQTQGQEYFPLTKEEAEKQGYRWHIPDEKRDYLITKRSGDLPDSINDTDDSILKEVIQCEHDEKNSHAKLCGTNCATAFKITPQELQFYKQLNLPVPRICFNCRHWERIEWRNWPELYERKCTCAGMQSDMRQETGITYKNTSTHFHGSDHCPNEFDTSYSPKRKEIVYCEQCYQQEVV